MVTKGSVKASPAAWKCIRVTDLKNEIPVSYTGVLPDLFREGQGVVAHGRMQGILSSRTKSWPSTMKNICARSSQSLEKTRGDRRSAPLHGGA